MSEDDYKEHHVPGSEVELKMDVSCKVILTGKQKLVLINALKDLTPFPFENSSNKKLCSCTHDVIRLIGKCRGFKNVS